MDIVRRLSSFVFLAREPMAKCTAAHGLVDALPADVLLQIVMNLESARDVVATAMTCTAFRRLVFDEQHDASLWALLCQRRWATKAYSPMVVHPHALAHLGHRQRFVWAERDGLRQLGTGEDLASVEEWEVKIMLQEPYRIGDFPYRLNGFYVSPSFGNEPRRWSVRPSLSWSIGNTVLVDGLPEARMVRRPDWGWELRSSFWIARSVAYSRQLQDHEGRALGGDASG